MKHLFLLSLAVAALSASAQNISGLYAGTLVNDSTKKVQNYELALSEYRGKITGYSYTTFVVNDTFYYSVKRIKATKAKGELIVEDVKMLANNFPTAPNKGVRQIVTIPLNDQDSITELKGSWKTTQTKVYYSLHGGVDMKRENDSARSALVHHLYELNELQRPQPAVAAAPPAKKDPAAKTEETAAKTSVVHKKTEMSVAKTAIPYQQRTTTRLQTLPVVSDSLVLSFYDNGVVDGDTISVFLNEENILSKTKLTAAAVKKTIYLSSTAAEQQLVLVAENLGSIPPNTGLLMVQDGPNRYEVRFSADLQTNAVLVFRKKSGKSEKSGSQ